MRTITLIVRDRPTYTAKALAGIAHAIMELDSDNQSTFDRLIISIDPVIDGHVDGPTIKVCECAAETMSNAGLIECDIYANKQRLMVGGNHVAAMYRAFEEHGSDVNLLIEDDAVLMTDSLRLINWYVDNHGGPFSEYTLMSMCNHRDFGKGQHPEIADDPSYLAESFNITSPFAFATTRHQWPFIKASWNKKTIRPTGWDFSLSFAMRLERRKAVHPVLSRCKNIGREGGVNETPSTFDSTQTGIIYSDGSYAGPYSVVAKVAKEDLLKLDDWMLEESRLMWT